MSSTASGLSRATGEELANRADLAAGGRLLAAFYGLRGCYGVYLQKAGHRWLGRFGGRRDRPCFFSAFFVNLLVGGGPQTALNPGGCSVRSIVICRYFSESTR